MVKWGKTVTAHSIRISFGITATFPLSYCRTVYDLHDLESGNP